VDDSVAVEQHEEGFFHGLIITERGKKGENKNLKMRKGEGIIVAMKS
jgi:hypothetical protein